MGGLFTDGINDTKLEREKSKFHKASNL